VTGNWEQGTAGRMPKAPRTRAGPFSWLCCSLLPVPVPYALRPGPVAQRLEQGTHNPLVLGSNPSGAIRKSQVLGGRMNLPIADAFASLRPYIVRIEWSAELGALGNCRRGTGSVIVSTMSRQFIFIATAHHVVPMQADEETGVIVVRIWRDAFPDRVLQFKMIPNEPVNAKRVFLSGSFADATCLVLPDTCENGRSFLEPGEVSIPIASGNMAPGPSTRIAWAGYPGFLSEPHILGRTVLCYFEGSVSALIDDSERQVFIVDGHAMQGVSGGPVWWQNEETGRIEVIGVMSGYVSYRGLATDHPLFDDDQNQSKMRVPGLCFVQPLHPIYEYVRKTWNPRPAGGTPLEHRHGPIGQ
jgi:hypothetical protein